MVWGGHLAPPSLWVTSWESLLWSHLMGVNGKSMGFDHRESDCDGERGGASTSTWIWADQVPTCSAQVVPSTSVSAHPQSQDSGTFWPGNLVEHKSAWFWFLRTLKVLEPPRPGTPTLTTLPGRGPHSTATTECSSLVLPHQKPI